jgi:SAM-dependent methyltransferase
MSQTRPDQTQDAAATDRLQLLDRALELVLPIYKAPGQALWRAFELVKVWELRDRVGYPGPVLEIGCADGIFSALVFDRVADGIDINARMVERARQRPHIYDRMHVMDARNMRFETGSFRTVFANCVIEHIPSLEGVLRDSFRVLESGGRFVATVPLLEMNNHLLLRGDWYASLRRRQLFHENLLSSEQWRDLFTRCGFTRIEVHPYLMGVHCEAWDRLDAPICIGIGGRYNVGAVIRYGGRLLPSAVRDRISARTLARLRRIVRREGDVSPCAAAIVAWKE